MMRVPIHYNMRSMLHRKGATALTVLAIALTVAVLIILLGVHQGFTESVTGSGREDNVLCLRKGSTSEGASTLSRDDFGRIRDAPGIQKDAQGRPMVSAEMYAGVTLPRLAGGGLTNISLRGVQLQSLEIRGAHIVEGRAFKPGVRELVVGTALTRRIKGCTIGGTIKIGKDDWPVVGILESDSAALESEVWGDVESVMQAFDASWFTGAIMRCRSVSDVGEAAIWDDGELTTPGTGVVGAITERAAVLTAQSERSYFEGQAGFLGDALMFISVILILLMGFGALVGCTNTLLAAIAGRTREIGGLLAIGYRPWQIFLGFLAEAIAIALLGAAVGIAVTLPLSGLETGTTNWQTFTEQAFTFRVNATVIITAIVLALAVGLLGGVFPAWRASRLKPVDALRRG
ncbi:MAG: hypothetical protein CMJ83_09820 [Planctomycetes bacterium]|nr:hypothetical protein [Planctomycetota bacterium]